MNTNRYLTKAAFAAFAAIISLGITNLIATGMERVGPDLRAAAAAQERAQVAQASSAQQRIEGSSTGTHVKSPVARHPS
jgi:hypothetical protein